MGQFHKKAAQMLEFRLIRADWQPILDDFILGISLENIGRLQCQKLTVISQAL